VPDPSDTQLIDFNNWRLRIRESPEASARLLLLFLGLTGEENSLWIFVRSFPSRYWIVAPRAPYASDLGGYSWRAPFDAEDFGRPTLAQLREGAEGLIRLVVEYAASAGIEADNFDVMGFSQGAAMCNVLGFLYPDRIGKTGILAGFVPEGLEEWVSGRPLEGKPYFVAHGTKDETISVDRARASIAILEQAGANVTYCEDEVGHKVSATCLRALKEFFRD
jgi:phospholipase/carboxylesterase